MQDYKALFSYYCQAFYKWSDGFFPVQSKKEETSTSSSQSKHGMSVIWAQYIFP